MKFTVNRCYSIIKQYPIFKFYLFGIKSCFIAIPKAENILLYRTCGLAWLVSVDCDLGKGHRVGCCDGVTEQWLT